MENKSKVRLLSTFFAHSYGQLITIISNLILPALLLRSWGVESYGYWVTVSAIAQFFILSDLGLINVSSNYFCMRNWENKNEFVYIFREIVNAVKKRVCISLVASIIVAIASSIYLKSNDQKASIFLTCFFLCAFSSLNPFTGFLVLLKRFQGKNQHGIFISNTLRMIEVIMLGAGAFFSAKFYLAAMVLLISKIIICYFLYKESLKIVNEIHGGDLHELPEDLKINNESKILKKNGIDYSKVQIGQTLILHGVVYILSANFGAVVAATYVTLRTASRLPSQLMVLINQSVSPELTNFYKLKKHSLFYRTSLMLVSTSALVSFLYLLLAYEFIDLIMLKWLGTNMNIDKEFVLLVFFSSFFNICNQSLSTILSSINSNTKQGLISMVGGGGLCLMLFFLSINQKISLFYIVMFEVVTVVMLLNLVRVTIKKC